MPRPTSSHEYPDDIFADTRMTFGEHIEELRTRMIRALLGLLFFMVIGFVLDAVGEAVGDKRIGIGRPMLDIITRPVETQVRDFYNRRIDAIALKALIGITQATPEEVAEIQEALKNNGGSISDLPDHLKAKLLGATVDMPVILPTAELAAAFGTPKEGAPSSIAIKMKVYPAYFDYLAKKGEAIVGSRQYLATLSVQEGFVVYFKVSLLCGVVLSSPWLLYQFWAFVGAGLYPHEKKYVSVFFWPSVLLFLGGVLLCQFVVLPGAVKALLKFNEFLGFDPDIRLNEWLGLAIILPLVFGVSFQTPLVMIFLNRIGVFSAADYAHKWRYACFALAFLSALITPTPDVVTMAYLFVPMFGLYLAGIVFCHVFPGFEESPDEVAEEEVAV